VKIIDVLSAPWAIIPERLDEITEIYSTHLRGEKIDIEKVEARLGVPLSNDEKGYDVIKGVAIVPIEGVIAKKMNLFSQISGGCSTQLVERDIRQALADDDVHSIVLHLDTPGGSVDGTAELGEVVFEARGQKRVVALADGLMASAGVWIGSAAEYVFMTGPTTHVGSIGVVTQHVDYSEAYKNAGIKVTEIYAGKYKRIHSSYKPLSKEGKATLQDDVDYLYSMFVDVVAKHRGTTSDDVLKRMADGRMFIGQRAIDAGLVDGVATLDQLIEALSDDDAFQALAAGAAAIDVSRETRDESQTTEIQESDMDLKTLKEKHPEVFAEARKEGFDEGRAEGFEAGKADGRTEGESSGADAERERIQDVEAQSMPGHEKLISSLKFDGKTTGPQAAVAVLNAEREKRASSKADRAEDAQDLDDVKASGDLDVPQPRESATDAQSLKAKWDADANLRAEFADDFESYAAFMKNEKRARVLGGKS